MLHRIPVTGPCPVIPKMAKASDCPIYFSNKNRETIGNPVIIQGQAHIQCVRLFTVNRRSNNDSLNINFEYTGQVIYSSILNNRQLFSLAVKLLLTGTKRKRSRIVSVY